MNALLEVIRRELDVLLRAVTHLNTDHGLHGHRLEIRK